MSPFWPLCAVACLSAWPVAAGTLNAQSREALGEKSRILTNVLISEEGKGDVFAHRVTVADGAALDLLVKTGLSQTCESGVPVAFEARNVTFTADADALPEGVEAETLYAEMAYGTLTFAKDCVSLAEISARDLDVRAATGDTATAGSARYRDTDGVRTAEISDLRAVSDAGVEVLSATAIQASYALDGGSGTARAEGVKIVPGQFLYADVVKRLGVPDPDVPMTGDLDAAFSLDDGTLRVSARADRVADLDLSVSVTGLGRNAMTGLFRSAEVRFADHGLLGMFEAWTGRPLAEALRDGDLKGVPAVLRTEKFTGIRDAVADWVSQGGGEVRMRPGMPVPLAALGAAAMLSPDRAVGMLGIQPGLKEDEENP